MKPVIRRHARTQGTRAKRHQQVGPGQLWRFKRDFQIGFLREHGLEPDHYLLDLGCGTLRGGIPLIDYLESGHYYGVEAREEVLKEARRELHEEGLESKDLELVPCRDLGELALPRSFDYIWAFSVLIHMTDEVLDGALGCVQRHLRSDGVFYANVNTQQVPRHATWQGFPVVSRSLHFYERACNAHGLEAEDLGSLYEMGHVSGRPAQDNQRMLQIKHI